MADSILWQILEKTVERLRKINFQVQPGDVVKPIQSEAIVIRKFRNNGKLQQPGNEADSQEDYPGILVTPSETFGSRPPQAGTNEMDDATYPVLLQVVARDDGDRVRQTNLRTYTKWCELICRAFQNQDFEGTITGDQGQVYIGYAQQTFAPDRSKFVVHKQFQIGVVCTFLSREPRGLQ